MGAADADKMDVILKFVRQQGDIKTYLKKITEVQKRVVESLM